MCFVCEASSRNILYSVPKPMKKYLIPWMIIHRVEKCFQRSSDTNAYLTDEQDESFVFQTNIYQKWDKSLNSESKHNKVFIFWPPHARLTAWPRSIATEVALLLAIKHLWLTWHIWQMKVVTYTAKMFILTSDAGSFSIPHSYFSWST